MSAPLLAVHSIMSPRRAEMAAALAPPSLPSSTASLTRSCVTFIGHVVALWHCWPHSSRVVACLSICLFCSTSPSPFRSPGATIQPSFHPYSFNDVIIFSHLFLGCFLPNFLAALLLLLVVVVVFLLFIRQTSSEQQEQQQLNWLAVRLLSRIPPWNMLVCINSS